MFQHLSEGARFGFYFVAIIIIVVIIAGIYEATSSERDAEDYFKDRFGDGE